MPIRTKILLAGIAGSVFTIVLTVAGAFAKDRLSVGNELSDTRARVVRLEKVTDSFVTREELALFIHQLDMRLAETNKGLDAMRAEILRNRRVTEGIGERMGKRR